MQVGRQSLRFAEAPFICANADIVGTREGAGPLGPLFEVVGSDDKFGQDTWEEAESTLQKEALGMAIGKSGVDEANIRYIFAGDLLGQDMATHFGLLDFKIPVFGIYGACSNCGEGLALAAMCTAAGYCDYAAAVTSSHFASAEKQFRFPLQYAAIRNLASTWTVTGSGAFIVGRKPGNGGRSDDSATIGRGSKSVDGTAVGSGRGSGTGSMVDAAITGITTGRIVDYGIKDAANMGACMAPAAMQCIRQNFLDFNRGADDYDRIITGDLGTVGREILLDLMNKEGYDISAKHEDCGILIYDGESQGTGAGGSGCGCSAVTLSAYYLPKIRSGELKRILFVPTGALLSSVSSNEGKSIPGIAHAIVIEGQGENGLF